MIDTILQVLYIIASLVVTSMSLDAIFAMDRTTRLSIWISYLLMAIGSFAMMLRFEVATESWLTFGLAILILVDNRGSFKPRDKKPNKLIQILNGFIDRIGELTYSKFVDTKHEMQYRLPPINKPVPMDEVYNLCMTFNLYRTLEIIKSNPPVHPFIPDGASCFPDKFGKYDIYLASVLHDLKYWCGLPGDEKGRFIADLELAMDVVKKCDAPVEVAELILTGVRFGGSERLPTPWRWGFGRDS